MNATWCVLATVLKAAPAVIVLVLLFGFISASSASIGGPALGWGYNEDGQCNVPSDVEFQALAGGYEKLFASLRSRADELGITVTALPTLGNLPPGQGFGDMNALRLTAAANTDSFLQYCHTEGPREFVFLEHISLDDSDVTNTGLVYLRELKRLKSIHLEYTSISDLGLENLSSLTRLHYLNLADTQISDAGLLHLTGMIRMKELYLDGTQVTNAGLPALDRMTVLDFLGLARTKVDDSGLKHLAGMTALWGLDVSGTTVTARGIQSLHREMPWICKVVHETGGFAPPVRESDEWTEL